MDEGTVLNDNVEVNDVEEVVSVEGNTSIRIVDNIKVGSKDIDIDSTTKTIHLIH